MEALAAAVLCFVLVVRKFALGVRVRSDDVWISLGLIFMRLYWTLTGLSLTPFQGIKSPNGT